MQFDRVLMHLRKSRADIEAEARGEGETLAKHEKYLLKFAKENEINIIEVRKELESGEFLIHRPKMLETLHEVEQGLYDGVLCMDVDRLGRGRKQDQGLILETFKNSGTKIITPRKVYDLDDEWDEEYVDFEQFMAHKELRYINRRLQRGRLGSVDSGNYIATNPPYGYEIKNEGKGNRYLVPHPEQAPVVKMIFEWYTNDDLENRMGSCKIANELNHLGYRTASGKQWMPYSVLSILKNAVYAGRIQWRKKEIKKSITPGKKKEARTRPVNEWIDVQGKHVPLVSTEIFQLAQAILKGKYHVPYQIENGITNPLAGLIRCKICGASMVLRPYTNQLPHLKCYNTNCANKSVRFMYVEERLIESLKQWLKEYKAQWERQRKIEKLVSPYEFLEKSLEKQNRELKEITEQKSRLHDFLEKGIYDIETFLERSKVIAERLELVRIAIEETERKLAKEKSRSTAEIDFIPKVEIALDLYDKTDDPAKKNNLLKSILINATYLKEKHQRDDDFTLVIYPRLPELGLDIETHPIKIK